MTRSTIASLIRLYLNSGFRGSWRFTDFVSKRLESLQSLPIEVDGGTLYADLRIGSARGILTSPRSRSGEDLAMREYIKGGDIVFDIGAHLGFYTLLLSKLTGAAGKVYAFEPNPQLLPSLHRTLEGRTNVQLFECALSDRNGKAEMYVPEDASMASLSDWTDGVAGKIHKIECEMRVLDEMFDSGQIGLPAFIKCDVEGGELAVFAGATKILNRRDAPVVLFEVNKKAAESFGRTVADYFEFFDTLEQAKYSFFEVRANGVTRLANRNIDYTNVLAVPRSRLR